MMAIPVVSRVPHPSYREHRVNRGSGFIHVREYAGEGPAFVPLHGFPDNLHIFDDLVPLLVGKGRKVVSFDFLGYGDSDKPAGQCYSFAQQLGDLETVVEVLNLDRIVPVSHDSAGPTAINFALKHPDTTAGLVILNSVYSTSKELDHPEFIEVFARPELKKLTQAILKKPEIFGFIMNFQREIFSAGAERRTPRLLYLFPWSHHRPELSPATKCAAGFWPDGQRTVGRGRAQSRANPQLGSARYSRADHLGRPGPLSSNELRSVSTGQVQDGGITCRQRRALGAAR
jgi:pimeloyl-ACP methyl ester carboxylesterase